MQKKHADSDFPLLPLKILAEEKHENATTT